MELFLISNELAFRLSCFFSLSVLFSALEIKYQQRKVNFNKVRRLGTNYGLVLINTLILRVLFPAGTVSFAIFAADYDVGLLNLISLPKTLEILLAFVFLDFWIWFQHRLMHKVPLLWRLHKVHHMDLDLDVSSAVRFHPIEILLSMGFKFIGVLIIGAPVIAVIMFEVFLNGFAMFNHANIRLPNYLDNALRKIVVTPNMHRIHHSVLKTETDSNFGFNLSIWDKLFGTYSEEPKQGHLGMQIGLIEYQSEKECLTLNNLLLRPFRK